MRRNYFREVEKQKGGKREGAGRKPIDDKAVPVTIYIPPSIIKVVGGKDVLQDAFKETAMRLYKKKKK